MEKIDRKDFIKIGAGTVAGGLAGFVFSGAPFQGFQRLAEWTQDQYVPGNGEEKYLATLCTACPGKCTISVRMIGERAVKIETSNGGCPIGQNALQLLYHPDRIARPLKLKGRKGKGAGSYEEVEWDVAIKEIAAKMNALVAANKANGIAAINKETGAVADLVDHLVWSAGSAQTYYEPSLEIQATAALGGAVNYDFNNADLVLSFGAKLLEGWGCQGTMNQALLSWMDKGAELIQIDATNTRTASMAKEWVAINGGTETVLACGIAHHLIREKHLAANGAGFGDWSTVIINQYPLEAVAKITGVPVKKIVELAEKLAKAKNPIVISGRGNKGVSSPAVELQAVHSLNMLVNARGASLAARAGLSTPPAGAKKSTGMDDFIKNGNCEFLIVNGADPVYKSAIGQALEEKLEKTFVVAITPLLNDTAVYADYILPSISFLEMKGADGTGVSNPRGQARHAGDSLIALGKMIEKTKGAFPWVSFADVIPLTGKTKAAAPLTFRGDLLKQHMDEFKKAESDTEYTVSMIPVEHPLVGDGDGMAFPYVLKAVDAFTYSRRNTFSTGKVWALMNRKTADEQGISEGESVSIESKRGDIGHLRVHLTDTIAPGVIAVPLGYGHKAYTRYSEDKGENPKRIMNDSIDAVTGVANWWHTRVKIS